MILALKILMAIGFIFTSGLLFSPRFSRNYLVIFVAAVLAVLSTLFVFDDVAKFLGFGQKIVAEQLQIYHGEARNPPFTPAELNNIVDRTFANVCRSSCIICSIEGPDCDVTEERISMLRLPLLTSPLDRRAYLVSFEYREYCGSAGCPGILLIISDDGTFAILHEDLGISDDTALLIAREAILRPLIN